MSKTNPGLESSYRERTLAVISQLKKAINTIEKDVEGNQGIYPYNKGRVTQAELCRRADIAPQTLYGEHHADTRKMVSVWLQRIDAGLVKGNKSVRKTVTARADEWKERFQSSAQQINLYHIDRVRLLEELEKAEKRIAVLDDELAQLRHLQTDGKVIPISPRNSKS